MLCVNLNTILEVIQFLVMIVFFVAHRGKWSLVSQ